MAKTIVQTDHAPKSFAGYSQAVKAAGLVFVSGQGPFDPATGALAGDTIQEQTAQCLRNVEAILRAAGSSLAKAVSATFILGEETNVTGRTDLGVEQVGPARPSRSRHRGGFGPCRARQRVGTDLLGGPGGRRCGSAQRREIV